MAELKEKEERLRFLVSKVDAEIRRFESQLKDIEKLHDELDKSVRDAGLQSVPIDLYPHSAEYHDLADELRAHILGLNKLKNMINAKLKTVIHEEELLEGLQEKYGDKVDIKETGRGEFELSYKDAQTESAYTQLKNSGKLISQLRESVEEASSEAKEDKGSKS